MRVKLVVALMFCAAVPCAADDRKDIESVVQRFATGFRNKDMKAVEAVTTPDFAEKGPGGEVMDTKGTKALYKQMWSMMKTIEKLEFKQDKITVKGAKAEATYKVTMTAIMPKPSNQSETQSMTSKGTSKLWLVKQKGAWKIQISSHAAETPGK